MPGGNRKRASSPKLILRNNALINATRKIGYHAALNDPEFWGRIVENAVGLSPLDHAESDRCEVFYWRDGNLEVDFVMVSGETIWAIEVKSGRSRSPKGLEAFCALLPKAMPLIIGSGGIPLEEFFGADLNALFT